MFPSCLPRTHSSWAEPFCLLVLPSPTGNLCSWPELPSLAALGEEAEVSRGFPEYIKAFAVCLLSKASGVSWDVLIPLYQWLIWLSVIALAFCTVLNIATNKGPCWHLLAGPKGGWEEKNPVWQQEPIQGPASSSLWDWGPSNSHLWLFTNLKFNLNIKTGDWDAVQDPTDYTTAICRFC